MSTAPDPRRVGWDVAAFVAFAILVWTVISLAPAGWLR